MLKKKKVAVMKKMLSKGHRSQRRNGQMERTRAKKVKHHWLILQVKSKYSHVGPDINKQVKRTGNSSMHKHFR